VQTVIQLYISIDASDNNFSCHKVCALGKLTLYKRNGSCFPKTAPGQREKYGERGKGLNAYQ